MNAPPLSPPVRQPEFAALEAEPKETSLLEWGQVLYRDKWSILGLVFVAAVIAVLYANAQTPIYRATAKLLIEPRITRPIQTQEVYDPGFGTMEYYSTQVEILRSRELAEKVVTRLDLTTHPEFAPKAAAKPSWLDWRRWLPFLPDDEPEGAPVETEAVRALLLENVIGAFTARVSVQPVVRTQLLSIHFNATSPELAQLGANGLAAAYIEYGLESRLEATQTASRWLTEKLGDIRTRLEQAEKNLQAYRDQQQLVNVGGVRTLLEQDIVDNSRRLRDAQKRKSELATTYWKIQQAGNDVGKLEEIGELLRSPLVQAAKTNLIQAREALQQLRERYGEKHPQIASGETRVEAAGRTFYEQLRLAAEGTRTEYEIARENERANTEVVDNAKEQVRRLDRRQYELRVLEREVDTNRQLYDLFLTRFRETDTSDSYQPLNARLVDPAILPRGAYLPNRTRILQSGILLGLLLGIGLSVIRRMLEETFKSAEEVEALTGLPVLGVLPRVSGVGKKTSLPLLFQSDPRTPFAEGVRSIRTGLQLSDLDKQYKRILVTSAVPGEGKSSVAATLAMAFATSEKVLLLDADLRMPSQKTIFGLDAAQPGLLEFLAHEAKFEDCIYQHKDSGLYILPVAKKPPNPTEVINSAAFAKLVAMLSEKFDRIIFDSPPCHSASDSLILARLADVVTFVVRADVTKRRTVATALKNLRQVQAHLIGTVLNQVDVRANPYYRDAYQYAGKYYG